MTETLLTITNQFMRIQDEKLKKKKDWLKRRCEWKPLMLNSRNLPPYGNFSVYALLNGAACIVNTWNDIYQLVAFEWSEFQNPIILAIFHPKNYNLLFINTYTLHFRRRLHANTLVTSNTTLRETAHNEHAQYVVNESTTIVTQPLEQLFASWSVIRKLTNFISLAEEQQESIFDDTIHS